MPLYEYRCTDCGARFEKLRSAGRADDPAECTNCADGHGERLLSRFSAVSKGEGGSYSVAGGCSRCAGGHCATCGSH